MKDAIVAKLEELLNSEDFKDIQSQIGDIAREFRKAVQGVERELLDKFVADGNEADDFVAPKDEFDQRFDALMDTYGQKKEEYQQFKAERAARRAEEARKRAEENALKLKSQREIVEELRTLVESKDQSGQAFETFKGIQERWNQIGKVSHDKAAEVRADFGFLSDKFFHERKILRDMQAEDQRRNLDAKNDLISRIEALVPEDSVKELESQIKRIQAEWRKIGNVAWEIKDELYERYKAAGDQVYAKINAYYDERKDEHRDNLKQKITLCESAHAIAAETYERPQDWQSK